jgi:hypothetical protein
MGFALGALEDMAKIYGDLGWKEEDDGRECLS